MNIIIQILIILFLYTKVDLTLIIIGYVIFGIWLISYLFTTLKNPGIPTKDCYMDVEKKCQIDDSASELGYLTCSICNVFVKKNVQIGHCLSCKVCIIGYDHHCGWSSKCIGEGNFYFFWIFLSSTCIYYLYHLIIFCVYAFSRG